MDRIDEPSGERRREAARHEDWNLGLLVATLIGVPLLVFAGFLMPGVAIVSIPLAIGMLVIWWLLLWGTQPPGRTERGLAIGTGAIVAAFFAFFGDRLAFLLVLFVVGAS